MNPLFVPINLIAIDFDSFGAIEPILIWLCSLIISGRLSSIFFLHINSLLFIFMSSNESLKIALYSHTFDDKFVNIISNVKNLPIVRLSVLSIIYLIDIMFSISLFHFKFIFMYILRYFPSFGDIDNIIGVFIDSFIIWSIGSSFIPLVLLFDGSNDDRVSFFPFENLLKKDSLLFLLVFIDVMIFSSSIDEIVFIAVSFLFISFIAMLYSSPGLITIGNWWLMTSISIALIAIGNW